jgi:hypothetical protein
MKIFLFIAKKRYHADSYLTHGTNKQIFYKIFYTPEDIDEKAIVKLLKEAISLDKRFAKNSKQ